MVSAGDQIICHPVQRCGTCRSCRLGETMYCEKQSFNGPTTDGGFGQYMSEFTTAVKYDMDTTHVLLNDDELEKISKEQRTGGWDVWQTDHVNSDFDAVAENCGGYGVLVDNPETLDEAIAHDGPALVEIFTDSDPV